MRTIHAIALAAATPVFGASLALGFATSPAVHAQPTPSTHVEEDQPGWSCVDDGNRVCGPDNANGAPAGCYDDGGVLEFAWPCTPWQPNMGYRHADGTVTYPNGDVWCPTLGDVYPSAADCKAGAR